MNKFLASAAFVALVAVSGSASAITVGITATGPQTCVIPGAAAIGPLNLPVNGDGTVNPVPPTALANIAGAYCTSNAKVTIKTSNGAITLGNAVGVLAPAPGGFANFVSYNATATWSGLTAAVAANGTIGATSVDSPTTTGIAASGALVVTGSTAGSTLPLVAGAYGDTLTVTLNPI